jgi:hypothetical protein
MTEAVILGIGVLPALVLISYLVEALRAQPEPPEHLAWAPDIPVRYVEVGGSRLRLSCCGL